MQNLLDNLKNLLKKDERLISEGELLKNKIIELAIKLDKDLIKLLFADKQMKDVFFTEAGKATIFDKDKFIKFVSNKQFLPDSYTAFKNKIGLTEDEEFIKEKKEVVLSWPYKDCLLEGGMTKEDQKRDEIFWNETLAPDEISRLLDPKVFTSAKRIDKKGEHKFDKFKTDEKADIKDNLIIKGNNLLALYSLKKRFSGKVKLIYIDPPYNTGNDEFKYNDAFNHSSWLTFIKNRLEVARELLGDDGVIFISCDDNEQAYLKVLCDEVFKREHFISCITVYSNPRGRQSTANIASTHEYLLIYSKTRTGQIKGEPLTEEKRAEYIHQDGKGFYREIGLRLRGGRATAQESPSLHFPIFINPKDAEISLEKKKGYVEIIPKFEDGTLGTWRWSKKKILENMDKLIVRTVNTKNGKRWDIFEKDYLYDGKLLKTKSVWLDKEINYDYAAAEIRSIFGEKAFRYSKPVYLLKKIIRIGTDKNSLVLDFFSGSGTTAQAVLELNKEDGGNRQFILCEQLDYVDTVTVPRVRKVIEKLGGGDFVYLELMKWNENFVEKIKKAKTKEELKKLWEIMKKKAFLSYKVDIKAVDEHAKDFEDLSIQDQKRFLLECLDKNHLYVNYSEIDDEEYGVNEEDKKVNKKFHGN